jgi:hypothetical protein
VDPQTTQVDDLRLVALPTAVNCADMFVRFALAEWSLRQLQAETSRIACALVNEVVGRNDSAVPGFITLRLRVHGDYLVVEVEDAAAQPPVIPQTLAGLQAGVMSLPGGGRLVWCELPLPTGMNAAAVPLPRRERRKPPATATATAASGDNDQADVDDEFFERLLSKLHQPPPDGHPGGLR